jgi:DNA-binding NtrC family response regulator
MLDVMDRVTPTSIPVLIKGESGVGKELVARALHENGPRSAFPFLAENCGAIPENLFESTLFGHMRGAFTGADRPRVGLFEAGDRGTLFLDEVGELPLAMQSKLLRVLEDGLVRPLGGTKSRKVDVRVIAATNRDLEQMCEQGKFRTDLLYRLNVMTIQVPSLRERKEDIPLLVGHIVTRYAEGRSVRVRADAMAVLQRYDWPGNVRQLENELRRALVLCRGEIVPADFSPQIGGDAGTVASSVDRFDLRGQVNRLERELAVEALRETSGNQTKAASLLGMSRYGLLKMMKRLEIAKDEWRG